MNKSMLSVFICMAILFITVPAVEAISYSFILHREEGKFSLTNVTITNITPALASLNHPYTAKIISFQNKTLYKTTFDVVTERYYSIPLSKDQVNKGQTFEKNNIGLVTPYYTNGKYLHIEKNGTLLLEAELSTYATCNENIQCDGSESYQNCPQDCLCGNKVCDPSENYLLCPSDCNSGQNDAVCDKAMDNVCDPNCNWGEDGDCALNNYGFLIYAIIVFVLVAGIILYWKIKNRR